MKTYSPKNPGDEISKIRSIFERNGYPQPIVDRIIYQTLHLKAPCGRSYVGRTPQELGERIKQHVPDDEPQLAINPGVAPVKRKPGRPKKSVGVTSNAVPISTQTLRSSSRRGVNVEPLRAAQMDGSSSVSASVARKLDFAITRHLN